jgi:catechol 2,3-dioxygenase-like lactoylglutathione lyase family enzyme
LRPPRKRTSFRAQSTPPSAVGITHVFSGLAVSDYESARSWYERLLGRPPDMLPKHDEAVWQLASTASIYVVADRERAGSGLVTIAVGDLEERLAELAGHGIPSATSGESGPRKVIVNDPDGNTIAFFEDPGRAN